MHPRRSRGGLTGFTLIELMIVLVIAAILAAIVYPSYQWAVRKAKRAEARASLFQAMQQQERFYSQRTTYIGFSAASTNEDEKRFKWYSGSDASNSAYELSARACAGSTLRDCVEISAAPGGSNVARGYRDPECGTLSLTSAGVQGARDPGCWK